MRLYADMPARRARQIVAEVLTVVGVALSIRAGIAVHGSITRLAEPGRAAQDAGLSLADAAGRGERAAADLPLVGSTLRRPFEALRDGGISLAEAGQAQQAFVADLALWLGVLVAALPVLVLLGFYLPRRIRWVREASAAVRLAEMPDGTQVLAARALVTLPLRQLAQTGTDPPALATALLTAFGIKPSTRREPQDTARPAAPES